MIINDKRALAYIVTVDEIRPIPGYDRVEHARTNGWWVITAKADNIKVGDKCVYFEVDSKCPSNDERFAFLEKRHYKIKTLRMCKVFSQGLLMPISTFPELKNKEVGEDVTDILKIKYAVDEDNKRKNGNPDAKYISMRDRHKKLFKKPWAKWMMKRPWGRKVMFAIFGRKKDNPKTFPTHFPFVHKTDEERVENMPWILTSTNANGEKPQWVVTEKLDGTSTTFILERKGKKKFEFYVLSRNIRQKDEKQDCYHDHNIYWDMAFKYDVENKLRQFLELNPDLKYVCLQGESVGSVQGNPLKLKEDDFYVFNFITSDNGRLGSISGESVAKELGFKWVPIVDSCYTLPDDLEEFKDYATAKSRVNPQVMREGVVLRSYDGQQSFKNVSREYLMKHNG